MQADRECEQPERRARHGTESTRDGCEYQVHTLTVRLRA
jgi:hypothetical protein